MNDLKDLLHARLFLLDMDGTIYLGNRLFPGVKELLEKAEEYPEEIRNRVEMIIFAQMRKYTYLFSTI